MHWVSAHQRWEAALLGAQCQEYFQFCKQANKNICLGPWAYIEWVTLISNKIMDGKERLVGWNKLILYIQFSIPPKKYLIGTERKSIGYQFAMKYDEGDMTSTVY